MENALRRLRPSALATLFGGYFALVMLSAWFFASGLTIRWFGPDSSRWVYVSDLVASAVFLGALMLFAFAVQHAYETRVREVNRQLGGLLLDAGMGISPKEVFARHDGQEAEDELSALELDAVIETLGEAQDQDLLMVPPNTSKEASLAAHRLQLALLYRREDLRQHERLLTSFLPGPAGMAVGILGISAAMLPATDNLLQSWFQLNTALILGMAYAWIGLAAYVALSALGAVAALPGESLRSSRRTLGDAAEPSRGAGRPTADPAQRPAAAVPRADGGVKDRSGTTQSH